MSFSPRQRILAISAAGILVATGAIVVWRVASPRPAPDAPAQVEAAPPGVLTMTPTRIEAASIVVAPVEGGTLLAEILAPGTVVATPQGEAILAARADGVVTRLALRLGDPVHAGQTVALIESRDASSIAAERASAQARLTAARQTLDREQRLFDARITARQDLEAAQTALAEAQAEARRTTAAASAARVSADGRSTGVVSPINGRVTAAPATLGAYVTAGTELFRVADPKQIEVQAALAAADAARINIGDRALISLPEGDIAAIIRSITPGVDAESRSATAVLDLSSGTGLRPGQAVSVRIITRDDRHAGGVSVPEEAVQTVAGREVVFVRTTSGFRLEPVTVGRRSSGRAEITSGLQPGQLIATRNAFLLKAELGKGAGEED